MVDPNIMKNAISLYYTLDNDIDYYLLILS